MPLPTVSELQQHVQEQRPSLIVTDFDGTFVANGLSVPPSTLAAYRRARQSGLDMVFATGRSRGGVEDILKSSGCATDVKLYPGVYLNGGVTYGPGGPDDIVWESLMDTDVVERLVTFIRDLNNNVMAQPNWQDHPSIKNPKDEHGFYPVADVSLPPIYIDIAVYSRNVVVFSQRNQLTSGFCQFQDGKPMYVGSIREYIKTHTVNKAIIFAHSGEFIDAIRDDIAAIVGNRGAVSGGLKRMLEINPAGVNKATAIRKLAEKLGVPLEKMVALGDGDNDAEMLHECGTSFAMGNASCKLQSIANYVTGCVNANGWSNAVDRVLDALADVPPSSSKFAHSCSEERRRRLSSRHNSTSSSTEQIMNV